jgi:molybdopterin molybdotransferase
MLVALLKNFGFEVINTQIVKESFDALKDAINEALDCQFIISTAGVLMDDNNYVKQVLDELDFSIKFSRVNVKPG